MMPLAATLIALQIGLQPSPEAPAGPAQATSTVGIEGRVLVRLERGSIVAKPVDRASPVVLRVADSAPDGSAVLYDLRFIGQVAGTFDLRDFLEHGDGTATADLAPITVQVDSLLPADHGGDLFGLRGLDLPRLGGYRAALVAAGLVWVAPLGWILARRFRRTARPTAAPIGPPRTLGDQLRPLVEAAISGRASTAQSAELEMLLLAYWRRQKKLDAVTPSAAIAALRDDAEAGELLLAMDRWLHHPAGGGDSVEIGALLARYRDVEPIELPRVTPPLLRQGVAT